MSLDKTPLSVVFVGTRKSVFVTRTAQALSHAGMVVSIVDPDELVESSLLVRAGPLGRALARLLHAKRLLSNLGPHDAAIMHYLSSDVIWLAPMLKRRFARVIGLAYGSDILRRKPSRDRLFRRGLRAFDCLAATNFNVMEAMISAFPEVAQVEHRIIRFGLPVLDELDRLVAAGLTNIQAKTQLGFDHSRIVVALGYSASPGQRQLELIDYFEAKTDLSSRIQFVVPVQYGNPAVVAKVSQTCARINAERGRDDFLPLIAFYNPEQSALLRMSTNVMINHSVSDAFSGSVQEVIHAGNTVLAADHLPYEQMPGAGTSIQMYSGLAGYEAWLRATLNGNQRTPSSEVLSQTRAALRQISGWAGVIDDWRALVSGEGHSTGGER